MSKPRVISSTISIFYKYKFRSIRDNIRNPDNPAKLAIYANETGVESDHVNNSIDLLSNGFKLTNPYSENQNGETFVYMAFAQHPFVSSKGVPVTAN